MIDEDKKQKMLDEWEEALYSVAEADDEEGGETKADVSGQGEQHGRTYWLQVQSQRKSMHMVLQSFD